MEGVVGGAQRGAGKTGEKQRNPPDIPLAIRLVSRPLPSDRLVSTFRATASPRDTRGCSIVAASFPPLYSIVPSTNVHARIMPTTALAPLHGNEVLPCGVAHKRGG
jgi:hypothetical protein